jgi:ABC-type Fe3+-hydroxamate transport system substrate-binding protein
MTVTRETYKEFIGRVYFGDLEPIVGTPDIDFEAVDRVVKNDSDVIFTWDYSLVRPQLRKLYEKAKNNQWNGETALGTKRH